MTEQGEGNAVLQAAVSPDCPLVPLKNGGHARYDTMFEKYLQSDAGTHHTQQHPRFYAGYGCAELPASLLLQLGEDAHPVYHMRVTHRWFQRIVQADPQLFTTHTVPLGRLAALFHDVGEGTERQLAELAGVTQPPGDIAHGRKTATQRANEEKIRRAAYRTILPEWPAPVIEDVEDVISHRARAITPGVYTPDDHPLAVMDDALDIAHAAGAVSIAVHAARIVQGQHYGNRPVNQMLHTLAHEVGNGCIGRLRSYASVFRLAGSIAASHTPALEALREAFATPTVIAS